MSDHHTDHQSPREELPPGVELRPHVFDGIEEFDQRLPNWWLMTFYGAIVFFVVGWIAYYQIGASTTDEERMAVHKKMVADKQAAELEAMFSTDPNGTLWKMSRNASVVEEGKKTFETQCYVCHGKDLSAMDNGVKLAGLPLNDKEWKYGGDPMKPENVFGIVKNGSPDTASGMKSWVPDLGPKGVANVVAFVLSHHEAPAEALAPAPAAPATK